MIEFISWFIIKYPLGFEDFAILLYAVLALPIPFLSYGWYKFCRSSIENPHARLWITLIGRMVLLLILIFFLLNLLSTAFRITLLVFGTVASTLAEKIISIVILCVLVAYLIIFPWKYLWRKDN